MQKKGDPPEKILHAGDRDTVAQRLVSGGIGGSGYLRPAIGEALEPFAFQGRQTPDEPGRVCGTEDQVVGILLLVRALGAGDRISPEGIYLLLCIDRMAVISKAISDFNPNPISHVLTLSDGVH